MRAVQHRQGIKIGAPEEPAWRQGFLSDEELRAQGEAQTETGYGAYLLELLRPVGRPG